MGLTSVYFGIQKKYEEKYGPNTVVIMQKGSFAEIYGYSPEQAKQTTVSGNIEGNLAVQLYLRESDKSSVPVDIKPYAPGNHPDFDLSIPIGKAREVSLILGMRLTSVDKKKPHSIDNPFMAGFPIISYENHRDLLLLYGYTIVRVDEVGEIEGYKRREITQISSPATEPDKNITLQPTRTNTLVSIYIEYQKVKGMSPGLDTLTMVCGLSSIDVSTGHNSVSEIYSRTNDELHAIQEIYRFLTTYQPVEILLNCNKIPEDKIEETTNFLNTQLDLDKYCSVIMHMNKIDSSYLKMEYQEEVLRKAFPSSAFANSPPILTENHPDSGNQSISESSGSVNPSIIYQTGTGSTISVIDNLNLELYTYGRISYIALLQHCYEHRESLISKLQKPKTNWTDQQSHLILAHNAIEQLDILPRPVHGINQLISKKSTSFDSLISVLDETSTKMGSRYLRERLLNPITNVNELESFYSMTDEILSIPGRLEQLESGLRELPDVEKFQRKVQLGAIRPTELTQLFNSYAQILNIYKIVYAICLANPESPLKSLLLPEKSINDFNDCLTTFWKLVDLEKLENVKYVSKAGGRQVSLISEESFIKPGCDSYIDSVANELMQYRNYLNAVCQHLNNQIPGKRTKKIEVGSDRKSKNNRGTKEFEEIDEEFDGNLSVYLIISTSAMTTLKKCAPAVIGQIGPLDFVKFKADKYLIHSQPIDLCTNKIGELQFLLETLLVNQYHRLVASISERIYFNDVNSFINRLDFICSNARTATKYRYHRPVLDFTPGKSYLSVHELRHPLIERIIRNEYVPNDITLGLDHCGVILFGINSSGKSSLAKSIGLAVIMAQAGMFVAGRMKYRPYQRIITRLSGNDDILRSQSSFVVEMMELKTILKNACDHSLIFGDELASTGETRSAEAITISTLEELVRRGSSFIFATHLHGIVKMEAVQKMSDSKQLKISHLKSYHDSELNKLVYDRRITDGPGSSYYSIDVCKSLGLPSSFIERAHELSRIAQQIPEKFVSTKKSKYNGKIFVDKCSICGKTTDLNTHHLKEQATADSQGFIDHFHKNSNFNLMILCQKCHQNLHINNVEFEQVSTLNGTYLKPATN